MDVHGFPEDNIDLLMDDGIHINPTKSNIIDAFKKLVELSEPGDVVYVHFAGKVNNTFKIFLRAFLLLVYTLKLNDILFCFMLSPSLLTKVTELMSMILRAKKLIYMMKPSIQLIIVLQELLLTIKCLPLLFFPWVKVCFAFC